MYYLHNRRNHLFPSLFLFDAHFSLFKTISTTSNASLFAFISLVWLYFPFKYLHSIQTYPICKCDWRNEPKQMKNDGVKEIRIKDRDNTLEERSRCSTKALKRATLFCSSTSAAIFYFKSHFLLQSLWVFCSTYLFFCCKYKGNN